MIRQAIAARPGLLLVTAGALAAGSAAWLLAGSARPVPASITCVQLIDPAPIDDAPTIAGNAPYINADLDGDGTPEVIVRGETSRGPFVLVQTADHATTIGTLPLVAGGCESEFTVDDEGLVIERYAMAPSRAQPNGSANVIDQAGACTNIGAEHYRVARGHLFRSDR